MEVCTGAVLEGKVSGITSFGAFITLPEGKTGLVHISEVAHSYVSDIKEHLKEGQEVKVKVIAMDKDGRINLSIKKAVEPPPRAAQPPRADFSNSTYARKAPPKESASFEDKLKQFMQVSDSKMTDLKQYTAKKNGTRRRAR